MSVVAVLAERVRAGRSSLAWLAPVGVGLALLTWHVTTVVPRAGLDNSWQIALHLAASHGLDFGRDVVFTYGPLGFLSVPLVVSTGLGAISFLFALLVQVALALVVLAAATRLYGRTAGIVLAFLALGLTLLVSDGLAYLALFAAVWLLELEDPPSARWLVPLGGFVAAFELLVKLNGGVLCLALFALVAWRLSPRGWRSELVLAASFAASVLVLWLVTGNAPAALPTWLRESRHVVGAYTDAMAALDGTGRTPETVLAGVLVAAAAAMLALHARRLPRARAAALVLVAAVYTYAYLKEGFVRHDAHVLDFFGAFAVAAVAFDWRGTLRWASAALVVGAAVATLVTPDVSLRRLYRPVADARHAVRELGQVVAPDRAQARADARAKLGVPERDLRLLRGHTVDSVPYETSAVWAYGLRWRPEPLLQWYMAYDGHLDAMNAAAVAQRGAERVLRQATAGSDGKVAEFEAPATYLALLCHYRELAADEGWEVLARTSDRCGEPRRLATVSAQAGKPVAVPTAGAGEIVVAHLHVPRSLGDRLQSLVLKPFTLPQIVLGDTAYRFVPATASGPLVMRLPAGAGRSPFFGGYARTVGFTLLHVPSPVTVEFDAISIRPEPVAVTPQPLQDGSLDGAAITVQGHGYRLAPAAFRGWVDVARPIGDTAALAGWAVDAATDRPAPVVAVFSGARLVGLVRPSETRPDIAQALKTHVALQSGYRLVVQAPAGKRVRVFALGGGRATELSYPPSFPWR